MSENDYREFLQIANEYGLSVEEKIYEIVDYYLLIQEVGSKHANFLQIQHNFLRGKLRQNGS